MSMYVSSAVTHTLQNSIGATMAMPAVVKYLPMTVAHHCGLTHVNDCHPPLRPHSHWATGIAQVTHANDCGHANLAMKAATPLSQLITVITALSPLVVQ